MRSYIDRGKLLIDGELLYPRRTDLEDYAVRKYACEEITFSEFAELYNGMLKENRIPFNEKLYYTEDVKRSRSNRFGDSKLCLWKQGERMRYYDIGSRDYTKLIDTLHLEGFQNTEVSTQKFMDYYPELMEEYDIHDRYELHNLLKKISKDYGLDYISFVRQPILRFGEFDREKNIFELIRAFSPVTQDELIDFDPAFSFSQVKIFVTSPTIKQIDLTGSGSMTVKDAVTASRLDIDITGTGNMSFTGTLSCNFLDVDITGSGNLDFANVKADKIETDVTGVGNVNYSSVNAGNIGSNITGAGNITIAGDAENHIKNVTGVGNIDDTNLKVGKYKN